MVAMQTRTRGSIRRSIGMNLGILIDGVATSTVDTSSLIDTLNLLGGDDEHNQKEVLIYDATGSIVAGESSIVSDFGGSSNDATCAPVFTASITAGDKYEMWKTPWRIADINEAINQAIDHVTNKALQIKETHTAFTESSKYFYDVLSGFTHLSKVEYVYSIGTEKTIHRCDAVWNELVDNDVTASLDTTFKKEGGGSVKLVVDDALTVPDRLLTDQITSLDLTNTTEVQVWIYSTVALAAGDLQLLLDNTAQCGSPVETLDIPATTANVWTRHIISLANPQSDSAIVSVGLKIVVDVGAFSLWVDDVKAIDGFSNLYRQLPLEYWRIAQGSTPYLMISRDSLSLVGTEKQLRLSGFRIPARLTADATNSEINPDYLVARATGQLLMTHPKSYDSIPNRVEQASYWLAEARRTELEITNVLPGETRAIY